MTEKLKIIISAEIDKLKTSILEGKKLVDKFSKEGQEAFADFSAEIDKHGQRAKKVLQVAAGAIAGAATALLALAGTTKEYRTNQAKLNTAFETAGASAETAKKVYSDLFRVLGDDGKATEAAQHLAKLSNNQKDLAEWTKITQGVYATFGDSLSIEGLTEAINHTTQLGEVQGTLADALEWSGISVDDFNEQLFWCNTESEREKLIRTTLGGLYDEAAEKYETNAAGVLAQNEAQEKLNAAMGRLGEATAPVLALLAELGAVIMEKVAPHIEELVANLPTDAIQEMGEKIANVIDFIVSNWEFISTLAAIILGIAAAISVFSTVMTVVNAVMYASPITWIVMAIVAAIAALVAIIVVVIKYWDEIKAATKKCWDAIVNAVQVAIDWIINLFRNIIAFVKENWQGLLLLLVNPFAGAFKLLYDNCEGFRNTINNLLTNVKNVFTNIGTAIKEKFNAAADTVRGIIDKIKGFFKFEWELPKLKTPKFAIKPAGWELGDLLKGVIPKLDITWNARGGVFDKPTMFSYGSSLQGIGENGAEAVVPLENNLEWLDRLADMLAQRMGSGTPIVLNVDGKTFAQTAINTINANTKQSGRLALNIL